MQVRKHPKIKSWPPLWDGFYSGHDEHATGEKVALKKVTLVKDPRRPPYRKPDHLTLTIEYEGNEFKGILWADGPDFVARLCEKLKSCIGMSIQEIGDLEVESRPIH